MVAFSQCKVELGTPLETIGHVPGVRVGEKFQNKGELAIMGVHCNISGGIYCKQAVSPETSHVLKQCPTAFKTVEHRLSKIKLKDPSDDQILLCRGKGNPAYSIVLSGNYSDDHDAGEIIDYTGQGGQDKDGRQVNVSWAVINRPYSM